MQKTKDFFISPLQSIGEHTGTMKMNCGTGVMSPSTLFVGTLTMMRQACILISIIAITVIANANIDKSSI